MNELLPQHRTTAGAKTRPPSMDSLSITHEERELVQEVALGIFTDMTNSGFSLQETLAAVYLSGAINAKEALKNK